LGTRYSMTCDLNTARTSIVIHHPAAEFVSDVDDVHHVTWLATGVPFCPLSTTCECIYARISCSRTDAKACSKPALSLVIGIRPGVVAGPKKLWNFEARACIGLQKNLDFINKNVRFVIRTPFQKLRYYFCSINVLKIHSCFIAILNASLTINLNGVFM